MSILQVSGLKKVYTTRFGGSRVEALRNVTFTAEQGEYVAIMGESGSGKTTLLNILAALDRPTAGTVELDGRELGTVREGEAAAFRRDNLGFVFQEFNLLDTFTLEDNIYLPLVLAGKSYREMHDRLLPLAEQLGIRLRFVCAMERRICAMDPPAMEQLLYHLLSNALKATPAGGEVAVELKKSGGQLLLSVTDTGCGIPPERLARLFDGSLPSRTEPGQGLGLGLPLCRAIAERQGGSITGASTPGQGSCFTVSLPDHQLGSRISDVALAYDSGFNRPLLGLADALPADVYTIRNQG